MYGIYMLTLTINIPQMLAYMAYIEHLGMGICLYPFDTTIVGNILCTASEEGARGIHIPYLLPIKWGAKELLRVSQPSSSIGEYCEDISHKCDRHCMDLYALCRCSILRPTRSPG